ncbi:hypothetical protein EAI_07828 [Harpegnathos saltator]|uniref:Uncharacterized protein n=1 Tax=Harpegnathos saltator TaxID=610380 RepID=E2BLI0_HARSA|nr:hypothetical protein EAI_07828 [Harpegnathos saltator]
MELSDKQTDLFIPFSRQFSPAAALSRDVSHNFASKQRWKLVPKSVLGTWVLLMRSAREARQAQAAGWIRGRAKVGAKNEDERLKAAGLCGARLLYIFDTAGLLSLAQVACTAALRKRREKEEQEEEEKEAEGRGRKQKDEVRDGVAANWGMEGNAAVVVVVVVVVLGGRGGGRETRAFYFQPYQGLMLHEDGPNNGLLGNKLEEALATSKEIQQRVLLVAAMLN